MQNITSSGNGSGPDTVLVQAQGNTVDEADDLTQSFFARLLEKNFVAQAEPSRGRFRTFLLAAVKHFLANEYDRRMALKRGGRTEHVSIDSEAACDRAEPAGPLTPEQLFDKRWAMSVVSEVLERVREEALADGRSEQLELLLPIISGDAPRRTYTELAGETGISEGALRVAVHRYRVRFREHLRRAVADTVAEPREVDVEIQFLINAVSPIGDAR